MVRNNNEESTSEFEEKVLFINRCSKVVKGGRKFSFSALVVVGDGKGRVGLGFAKANEVADAIKKASEKAKTEVITVEMENTTIPHEVDEKQCGCRVFLKPARPGTGVIAGSAVRPIVELAGIQDVMAKNISGSNQINIALATMSALKSLKNREKNTENRRKR
ncbi:MAG: 30S ribosomal protein S5 [Chlamydiia bacterium]|nr:30S ribosomal protein S5 [Chlamydiia bacterium]